MTQINLHEAKARFSHYTKMVKAGETVILCDRNKPFAEIRPLADPSRPAAKRELGQMKGMCPVESGFFEADADIASDFEASEIFPTLPATPTTP